MGFVFNQRQAAVELAGGVVALARRVDNLRKGVVAAQADADGPAGRLSADDLQEAARLMLHASHLLRRAAGDWRGCER